MKLSLQRNAKSSVLNEGAAFTPLHYACGEGYEVIVKLFLEHSTKKDIIRQSLRPGDSLLDISLVKDNYSMTELLLKHEGCITSEINLIIKQDKLIKACRKGDLDVVSQLLSDGNIDVNQETRGSTPLLLACEKENVALVQLLLEHGTKDSVNQEINGRTPLLLACEKGNVALVQLLLKHGAKDSLKHPVDEYGETLLLLAVNDIVEALREQQDPNFEMVQLLLEHGVDAFTDEEYAHTQLLMRIVKVMADQDAIEDLLKKNADDINRTDSAGQTILLKMIFLGNEDIIKLFIKYGADVNQVSKYGHVPLHNAFMSGNLDIVKLLLQNGADKTINQLFDDSDNFHNSPLSFACEHAIATELKDLSLVQLLLDSGANANQKNKCGETLLYRPCMEGCIDLVKLLLKYSVKEEVEISSLLQLACGCGYLELALCLLDYHSDDVIIDCTIKDSSGFTLLAIAMEAAHTEMVRMLIERLCNTEAGFHPYDETLTIEGKKTCYAAFAKAQSSEILSITNEIANKKVKSARTNVSWCDFHQPAGVGSRPENKRETKKKVSEEDVSEEQDSIEETASIGPKC